MEIKFILPSGWRVLTVWAHSYWSSVTYNLCVVHIPLSVCQLPEKDNEYRFAICNCPNPSSWLHWALNDQMFHHYYGIRAELNRQMCVSLDWLLWWQRRSDYLLWLGQWVANPPTAATDPACQPCPAPLRALVGYATRTHTHRGKHDKGANTQVDEREVIL